MTAPKESHMAYLRRAVDALSLEDTALLRTLPSPEALLEFHRLVADTYGGQTFADAVGLIAAGASRGPLSNFCFRHDLKVVEDDSGRLVFAPYRKSTKGGVK